MTKLINSILMVITALFIVGCESGSGFIGGGDPIEGEWRFESEEGKMIFSDGQVMFFPDNFSYVQIGEEQYEFTIDGERGQAEVILDGDRMIIHDNNTGNEDLLYRID